MGLRSTLHEPECLEKDRVLLGEREKLTEQLTAVAPKLAAAIANGSQDPVWDTRMATIEDSWAWACANEWTQAFFDDAAIRYGSRIVLSEHFRCMPEIIRFSNNLC